MDSTLSIKGTDPTALARLSAALERAFSARGALHREVVFACIGTDRSTGDALGPLVGQRLSRLGCPDSNVIGTLKEPLHALNLHERLDHLVDDPRNPLVVAVDAALGSVASVGTVSLRPGGLHPGQGVGKRLPQVGEMSITATVNVSAGALDAQVLQSTRLFMVQELAETIATACWWSLRMVRRNNEAGRLRQVA
ncbi:MAG: spore protease YyaC [Thermoleophilia bacterium]